MHQFELYGWQAIEESSSVAGDPRRYHEPEFVNNIGGGATSFSLSEINKGAVPFTTPPITTEARTDLYASTAPAPVQLTAGPWQPMGDIDLVLDDGSMEDSVGVNSSSAAFQFIWLNRFTPDPTSFPFSLEQVSVVWPTGQVASQYSRGRHRGVGQPQG